MYRFQRQSARVARNVETEFECAKCGYVCGVRVLAVGSGSADAYDDFRGQSAEVSKQRAIELAGHDAAQKAHSRAERMPCPQCGFVKKSLWGIPVVLVFTLAGWAWGFGSGGVILAIFGLGGGALVGLLFGRVITSAGRPRAGSIELLAEGTRPGQLAGKPCIACEKRILLASEGTFCETCSEVVHIKRCHERHVREKHGPDQNSAYRA